MPRPMTRNELDRLGCAMPNCTHDHTKDPDLFFHARCHMSAGSEVSYNKQNGVLTIKCKQCKKLVAEIAVHH